MKVNYDKTEAMWIGKTRFNKDKPLPLSWTDCVKILGVHLTYDDKVMNKLNFEDKLKSLKQLIALWKQRDLDPLGKIVIMKSFGLSKFLYISSVIGMPETIQKKINTAVFGFIWKGSDKVKRAVLTSNYSDGGLKMINLSARIRAQKLMWIKRFSLPFCAGWKFILGHYLSGVGGLDFLRCNFDVSKLSINISPFYREVLSLWGSLSKNNPVDLSSIVNQVIWNNQYILIGQKFVYYKNFVDAGFIKVDDLLDLEGKFIKFENTGLPSNNFLRWYGIICAIPKQWLDVINLGYAKGEVEPDKELGCNVDNIFIPLQKIQSRIFYDHFNAISTTEPVSSFRLKRLFNLNDDECHSVYELPFKVTLDSRLRWLQYRINHGILVTNSWLHRVGIKDDDTCMYCDQVETIAHLYTGCDVIKIFWDDISANISFMPRLNVFEKLYGHIGIIENFRLINQLLIIARQCIYVCKGTGKVPNFYHFKNMIAVTMALEKVNAIQQDKTDVYLKKWEPVTEIL